MEEEPMIKASSLFFEIKVSQFQNVFLVSSILPKNKKQTIRVEVP